jgi:hypothetical protein
MERPTALSRLGLFTVCMVFNPPGPPIIESHRDKEFASHVCVERERRQNPAPAGAYQGTQLPVEGLEQGIYLDLRRKQILTRPNRRHREVGHCLRVNPVTTSLCGKTEVYPLFPPIER